MPNLVTESSWREGWRRVRVFAQVYAVSGSRKVRVTSGLRLPKADLTRLTLGTLGCSNSVSWDASNPLIRHETDDHGEGLYISAAMRACGHCASATLRDKRVVSGHTLMAVTARLPMGRPHPLDCGRPTLHDRAAGSRAAATGNPRT